MDMQEFLDNTVKAQRAASFANSPQLSLGELIAKIEPIAAKQKERVDNNREEAQVYFDFEYLYPDGLSSWRGSYAEIALGFSEDNSAMAVTSFLQMLKAAVGKTYTGYKGGEFTMSRQTPVWVANWGNSGNTGVVGVLDLEYQVIIQTAYVEY